MLKIIISFLMLFTCSLTQVYAHSMYFANEDLQSITCKATNGVDIKTDKIENGVHWVETNWFGLTKYYKATLLVSKNQIPTSILLESVDQGYIMVGKIERNNPSQSVTMEIYARHPTMRIKVTDANCILEFKR